MVVGRGDWAATTLTQAAAAEASGARRGIMPGNMPERGRRATVTISDRCS